VTCNAPISFCAGAGVVWSVIRVCTTVEVDVVLPAELYLTMVNGGGGVRSAFCDAM